VAGFYTIFVRYERIIELPFFEIAEKKQKKEQSLREDRYHF